MITRNLGLSKREVGQEGDTMLQKALVDQGSGSGTREAKALRRPGHPMSAEFAVID